MHDKVCNLGVFGKNDTESRSHLVEEYDESARREEDFIRRSVAVLLIALVLLSAFQATVSTGLVKAEAQPIWSMEGYDARHTGQCPYDTSTNNGNLEWKFKTGEKIWSSQAIGTDGTIYTGSRDRCLYAVNPNGTLRWKFKTGGWIVSSPAVASDGTVLVGSRDEYFYAINPDGTLKWKVETGDVIYSSPVIGADGTIYVGANINHLDVFHFLQSYLYALNPDGTLKWKFKAG
ncbi:MAG: outer membrane protein assembly factor BamB family protein, partial [Candidatus Cryosericum sp.]